MSIDYAVAMEMQRICTGDTRELTRGQIAGEVLDLKIIPKSFNQEAIDECNAYYDKLVSDETKKMYDVDALLEETETLKAEFQEFVSTRNGGNTFQKFFDDISNFFINPPFEGLDGIEYGVNEVCVFSVLEYFVDKTAEDHDHEKCRMDYRNSIAERTYEATADHWIGVYDDLQKRYADMGNDFEGEYALEKKMMSCSIVALSAIKDQDSFVLDIAQAGADKKAEEIFEEYNSETYKEGSSALTDNVVRLFEFLCREIRK